MSGLMLHSHVDGRKSALPLMAADFPVLLHFTADNNNRHGVVTMETGRKQTLQG